MAPLFDVDHLSLLHWFLISEAQTADAGELSDRLDDLDSNLGPGESGFRDQLEAADPAGDKPQQRHTSVRD
ncbi:MAG: hypothetical protein R3C19_07340 [Planctomycetaceae bacterium]